MNFGENIRRERETVGLSRSDLAKTMSCTPQHIFYLENRVSHQAQTLVRVADAIGCDVTRFFEANPTSKGVGV